MSARPRVVVVGLGPAGPELLTTAAVDAIGRVSRRYLRTARHPAAAAVPDATPFDDLYDGAATFDEVYRRIVETLVDAASVAGEVLYAVPGSPLVAERAVALLLDDERVDVDIVAGLSFLDLAWARLGVDPLDTGARLVDGRRFAVDAAGERGPLLVAQCDAPHVLSEVKLAVDDAPAEAVTVLQRLGLPDEAVFEVAWDDLDRAVEPDHLTSLWIPHLAAPVAVELARFADLVRTLRERCPWDREQTHESLARHLLEESYEALEALESLDGSAAAFAHLEEELGDLLFQVYFHATLAAEEGRFTLADVARTVHDKLVHRHPHVFGEVEAASADEVAGNWEEIKRLEKGRASIMEGIPAALPALLYAQKVQKKAASLGLDLLAGGDPEVASADELGELLFSMVGAARRLGVDPEMALRAATARHRDRAVSAESGNVAGSG